MPDDPTHSDRRIALLRAMVQPKGAMPPPALRDSEALRAAAPVPIVDLPAEPSRQDAASLVGRTLAGKYTLKRMLGEGGMGAVYEGIHAEIGKRVAVKLITNESDTTGEVAARFKREAQAANAARSDHLVEVFDVGRDPKLGLYMVLEFLEGEDLETRLLRDKRLDLNLAVNIALQVSRGLAKAHAAGVVHRDLKPANIFLTTREDGTLLAKVVDFGISKFVNEERPRTSWIPPAQEKKKLTRVGGVIGTPQYMSPEQARGLSNVSHRSDVWSLAAVLYETLAGRPAYEEQESYEDMLIAIVTTDPPPLAEIAPWVPAELSAVLQRCFVKDPLQRMADCVALQQAILEAVPGLQPETSGGGLPLIENGPNSSARLPEVKASRALTMSGVSNTQRDSAAPKIARLQSVMPGSMRGASKRLVRTSLVAFIVLCLVGTLAIGRLMGRDSERAVAAPPPPVAQPLPAPSTPVPAQLAATTAPAPPPASASATPPAASASAAVGAASASAAHGKAGGHHTPGHAAAPGATPKPAPPAHKFGDVGASDQY